MRISTLISRLQQLQREEGDIEIERSSGGPFRFIDVMKDGKWVRRSLASFDTQSADQVLSDHDHFAGET